MTADLLRNDRGQMQHARLVAITVVLAFSLLAAGYAIATHTNINPSRRVGEVVDSYNGVKVYYDGGIVHVSGRNLAPDGYNLGLKYQCVEFVKRYYYERFHHEMPEPRGNAADFFNPALADGALNTQRGLLQFRNGSQVTPQVDDILVLGPVAGNPRGHVAIVSNVDATALEIVQQNPGPFVGSRRSFALLHSPRGWTVDNTRVLGWLRLLPRDRQVTRAGGEGQ